MLTEAFMGMHPEFRNNYTSNVLQQVTFNDCFYIVDCKMNSFPENYTRK